MKLLCDGDTLMLSITTETSTETWPQLLKRGVGTVVVLVFRCVLLITCFISALNHIYLHMSHIRFDKHIFRRQHLSRAYHGAMK